MKKTLIIMLVLTILSSCVGSSTTGVFGTGVSIALDPRTLGTQIDDSIMQKSLQARLILNEKKYFIDRKIVIAKEMTKIHEEFIRTKVESIKSLPENLKGELTVILSEKIKGKNKKKEIEESVTIEIKKMLKKYSLKDVVEFISKKESLSKKMIYNYCLKLKK